MKRFIEGDNRQQITLLPESLDEYIDAENPVRIVDMFVDQLDLGGRWFRFSGLQVEHIQANA